MVSDYVAAIQLSWPCSNFNARNARAREHLPREPLPIVQRLPPGLYDIAKRLRTRFKCDGRRKLYDRPTADGPLSRYYKSFRFSASSERQPRRRSFPPKSLLPIANRTRRPLLPPVKFPIAKRLRHKHSRFFFFCISLFSSVFPLSFLFYLFIYFFFFLFREKKPSSKRYFPFILPQ